MDPTYFVESDLTVALVECLVIAAASVAIEKLSKSLPNIF